MRYIALLILLISSVAHAQQLDYGKFVTPDSIAEATHVTFTGKNYAAQLTATTNDTIDISAGWNTNQPFNLFVTASGSITLRWGTTIYAKSTTTSLVSGSRYLFTFTYGNSKWWLNSWGYDSTMAVGSSGTVTSVTVSGANGIGVSGSPITTSGTIALTLGTLTGTTWNGVAIGPTYGGTGLTSYTTGDIIYSNGTNVLTQLPIGTSGSYIRSNGSAPTWFTPTASTTTSIIDMSSPASQLVKDTALSGTGTLIHVSSKPTIPQFYYVVKSSDIPTNTIATSYMAVLTIGGKNRHTVSAVTVNWVACRGTNPATEFASSSSVSTAANNFWTMISFFNSRGVVAGDTLGVKMWSGTIDTTDFRYATIYFIPRLISPPSGQFYFYGQTNNSTSVPWDYPSVLGGANAGVTYTNFTNQPTMFMLDSAASTAFIQPLMTQTMPQLTWTVGNGQYFGCGQSAVLSDVDNTSTTNATAVLYQFPASNGTARRIRYFRKWVIGIN